MEHQLTLLTTSANQPGARKILTKTFTRLPDGTVEKADYDNAWRFDADTVEAGSIHDLSAILTWLETQPYSCVVRGEPIGETKSIRRALYDHPDHGPATLRATSTGRSWLMLDFDKIPVEALELE